MAVRGFPMTPMTMVPFRNGTAISYVEGKAVFFDKNLEVVKATDYALADPFDKHLAKVCTCLLYTSPSPRDLSTSRMPSSA